MKKSKWTILLWPALFVLMLLLFDLICDGKVLTISNINTIVIHSAATMMIAWAFCFVFALGYMDLSIFSVAILASFAGGELGNRIGTVGVLVGAIIVAMLLMFFNFMVHAKSGIPSWIGGLGMCLIYEAIAALYSSAMIKLGSRVVTLEFDFRGISKAPYVYIVIIFAFIWTYLIYNKTNTGLNGQAIGDEPNVAKAMGINFQKTVMQIGISCGVLVGFAGAINISLAGQVSAQTGLTSLSSMFQPLAAIMFAQIVSQIDKRINIILATPFCVFIIYALFNVLSIVGIPSGTLQSVALGTIILSFGIIANINTKGIVK